MAGGIFVDQPFHLNPKCIVFGVALCSAYWYTARPGHTQNIFLLPAIFVIAYVAMAWYDYMYECKDIMKSGSSVFGMNTLDAIFKPQYLENSSHKDKDKIMALDQVAQYKKRVYLFHLIAIAPLLAYVGYYGRQSDERVFPVLLAIAFLAAAYHGGQLLAIPRD
jgi:hypothetical protein